MLKRLLKGLWQTNLNYNFGKPDKAKKITITENPDKPKMPKPEERHDLQNTLTFQNEAGVGGGDKTFQNARQAAPHERVRQKIIWFATAQHTMRREYPDEN